MQNEKIIIRFATINDIEHVMEFLKKNWFDNHVMANSFELMQYEHGWNGSFTYVIAEGTKTRNIYGVCGYLPYSSSSEQIDIGAGIWKAINSSQFLLGTEILKFVQNNTNCRMFACCGTNPKTDRFRKLLGHTIGNLNHFYRLSDKKQYHIAIVHKKTITDTEGLPNVLVPIKSYSEFITLFDVNRFKNRIPFRDNIYIKHRYFEHIKYKYLLYGIMSGNTVSSVIIGRENVVNDTKVFRIVDFIGNEIDLIHISCSLQCLMDLHEYEYVDFYNYGIDKEIMLRAGFVLRKLDDDNIIPNYFEPFVQKNVEIRFSTNVDSSTKFYMFKADGDQDRPNTMV